MAATSANWGASDRENRGHGGGVVEEARTIKQNPRGWVAVANESMEIPRSLDLWTRWCGISGCPRSPRSGQPWRQGNAGRKVHGGEDGATQESQEQAVDE